MDARQAPALPSVLRALLLGSGLAAAAFTASLLWGATPAHADDGSAPSAGLLGGVSQAVDSTAGSVVGVLESAPVTHTTAPVLAAVDQAVHTAIAAVPVAGPALTPVTDSVPTTPVVAPITGLIDEALEATSQVVGGAGGAVDDLLPLPTVTTPSLPGIATPRHVADPTHLDSALDLVTPGDGAPSSASMHRTSPLVPMPSTADGGGDFVPPFAPTSPSPRGADTGLPANTGGSSAGGGSATGAAGDTGQIGSEPYLTALSATLPSDDSLPSSPVFDTDSSPD